MAGGKGTRFWPLSTTDKPKQLLSLLKGSSLLNQTIEYLIPIVTPDRIHIVTPSSLEPHIKSEVGDAYQEGIIPEPARRNTLPCSVATMPTSKK